MKLLLALVASLAFIGAAQAESCADKAVGKNGKPLAGAAKDAFMKKCEREAAGTPAQDSCESKAIDKNGKPLHGAAKGAFIKKCNSEK